MSLSEALLEVEDMADINGWSWEDVAYLEIGDGRSPLWGDEPLGLTIRREQC